VESGIGWIPFVLEAMDYQFQGNSVAEEHPEFDLLPVGVLSPSATSMPVYWL